MEERQFQVPRDQLVKDEADLKLWLESAAHRYLVTFLETCNTHIRGKRISEAPPPSPQIERLLALLDRLTAMLEAHPPIQQPQRFGNKAFRAYHAALVESAEALVRDMLPPAAAAAAVELAPYLTGAFGNPTRLDYGTGHETSFVVLLVCMDRLGLFAGSEDYANIPLRVFDRYVRLCRAIQRRYMLEPAGSHGVWSLDDYQFVCFLWGSAQLMGQVRERARAREHEVSCADKRIFRMSSSRQQCCRGTWCCARRASICTWLRLSTFWPPRQAPFSSTAPRCTIFPEWRTGKR